MDLIVAKWQLNFGSCNPPQKWSEIILVISNRTRAARTFDFDFRPNCTPLRLSSVIISNKVTVRRYKDYRPLT